MATIGLYPASPQDGALQNDQIEERLQRIKEHVDKLDENLSGTPALGSSLDTIETKDSAARASNDMDIDANISSEHDDASSSPSSQGTKKKEADSAGLVMNLQRVKDMLMEDGDWEEGEAKLVNEHFKDIVVSALDGAQKMVEVVKELSKELKELQEALKSGEQ